MFKTRFIWAALLLVMVSQTSIAEVVWQPVDEQRERGALAFDHSMRHFRVDSQALRQRLRDASLRHSHETPREIELPMPDGSLARYQIYESPIMSDGLMARYPDVKTYKVYGIDDPSASGRLDITSRGFHAMLFTAQGRVFIDPDTGSDSDDLYALRSRGSAPTSAYHCGVDEPGSGSVAAAKPLARISGSLLEYRLAVAATEEYVASVAGSIGAVDQAQEAIVTAINRVNEIYERDLGIRLRLVSDNDQLIENGDNVVFSDGNPALMFLQNQAWIDSQLGNDGYDLGHVFSTNGGGLAFLGAVCDGNNKAKGVSGIPDPLGDPFYIDFVAHEIGHQFNAEHSFNGTTLSCFSGRNAATALEPGSGSSIMGYAGICGVENIQSNSDAVFHAGSIDEIGRFTAGAGSCYEQIAAEPVNPTDPVVAAIANKIIPANTAFVLEVSASDAEDDVLTYQWDQMNSGCPTDARSFGTDIGTNPLFRSFLPRDVSSRHFPALGTQLRGLYDDAEVIPCNDRDLDFRVTARDQANGLVSSDTRITVRDTGAVFEITNFKNEQTLNSQALFNLNWRVAGTNSAPINCSNVDIDLLTFADNYASYSVTPLRTATPNDGLETLQIPAALRSKSHPRARMRVKCSDNYFYDISDVDFEVEGTDPTPDLFDDSSTPVFFNATGTTGVFAPACGVVGECQIDSGGSEDDDDDGGGSGSADYRWTLLLAALLLLRGQSRRQNARVRACSEA